MIALTTNSTTINAGTSTRTVDRALALLSEVCAEESITLTEAARRAHLPASTALRLLRTLEGSGFVARDDEGSFGAGPRLIQLGATAIGRQTLVRISEPALHRIVAATGESAYLSIAGPNNTGIYVAMVEGTHSVRHTSWIGRSVPLENLAVGRALKNQAPSSDYVAERDRMEPDVTAIAAPIRRPGGVAGALSVLGPTYRIDDETMQHYGQIVASEARALGAQLGVEVDPDPEQETGT
ncbi:IclR family transcriptional regulator [Jatrophihabitans telluris]|uniref:IclR family transcriptional regulator n=1 Tax=Jatrophihabitans telluris TaxID=2038343 RepID=A0ABY4QZV3_9ACTN|nr:IclR family transcriptional regulator [Jatrophihabitans telluris]UQX88747.1 IclR family transcriptional regulator [Jatrophihabitans telluris]